MGAAATWLTETQRREIAEQLLVNPKPYGPDEIGAHCPFHTEKTPGGAFSYNAAKDVATCLSCGESTDLVGIYNAVTGRTVSDGEGFIEFRKKYAPHVTGEANRVVIRKRSLPRNEQHAPRVVSTPPDIWSERAGSFLQHSVDRLAANTAMQDRLALWGISDQTAQACRFGWNDRDKFVPVSSWGLPRELNRDGRERKIYLPAGLVIPLLADGRVIKIKIRKDTLRGPDDARYMAVKGGSTRYHIYGRPEWTRWVLVETERDAALVWQELRGWHIGGVALGSASARPDEFSAPILRRSEIILNALDSDHAGAVNSWKFWAREYPNSVRWPSPPSLGKDVGDAVGRHDLRAWAWAGLPDHCRRTLEHELRKPSRRDAPEASKASAPQPEPKRSRVDVVAETLDAERAAHLRKFMELFEHCPIRPVRIGTLGAALEMDIEWERENPQLVTEADHAFWGCVDALSEHFKDLWRKG